MATAMEMAGLVLAAIGLWAIFWPAALIVTGAVLVFLAQGVAHDAPQSGAQRVDN